MQHRAQLLPQPERESRRPQRPADRHLPLDLRPLLRIEHAHTPYTQDYLIYDPPDRSPRSRRPRSTRGGHQALHAAQLLNAISTRRTSCAPRRSTPTGRYYFDEIASRVYARYQVSARQQRDGLRRPADADRDPLPALPGGRGEVPDPAGARPVDEFQDTNFASTSWSRPWPRRRTTSSRWATRPEHLRLPGRGLPQRAALRARLSRPHQGAAEQNYRSTSTSWTRRCDHRPQPQPHPTAPVHRPGAGEKIALYEAYDENDEAVHIVETIVTLNERAEFNPGGCAVMYRTTPSRAP